MARGGRRAGKPGTKYTNRSDLQGAQLPVSAPTGLPYGDRAKLVQAQRAVPMGTPGSPPPGAGTPPSQPPAAGPAPGSLPFTGPTERPNEPVTAGLPIGPGAGPESLTMNQSNPQDPIFQAVAALDALGSTADRATAAVRDAVHAALSNRMVP
jgi:hypothetical protein